MTAEHVDVLIIGAGISGVGAACHLRRERPGATFALLERRHAIGGTWDLFRYPGVRSDSDMLTFGFNFRPWNDAKVLADGTSIREYVQATADEYGIDEHIHFGVRVIRADWSSTDDRWTVTAVREDTGERETFTSGFLMACSGYYDYDEGYRPTFAGEDDFAGQLVHPQHWPADLDHAGKQVVIIGSGATAVTLLPAMAETAAHVTMLQRSPTYIVALPAVDKISLQLRRVLPDTVVYKMSRARNIAVQRAMYAVAKARPALVKGLVRKGVQRALGADVDLADFTPTYDPWDQRLCVVPDGDLFRAVRDGKASVVTDEIDTFTAKSVRLRSGRELEADVVVTATGLQVQLLGGASLSVDGEPFDPSNALTYKGVLLEGLPNAALVFGYINASWTLKADLAAEYVCRLLGHMADHGYTSVVPRAPEGEHGEGSVLDALASGYVRRGGHALPRQGRRGVWRVTNDYLRDVPMLRHRRIADDALVFGTRAGRSSQADRQSQTV